MISIESVRTAIEPVLQDNDISKSTIRTLGGNPPVLEISIYSKNNKVDLDLCEKVSREISAVLDQIDDAQEAYMLDVCSYGAERELESSDEIRENIGSYIHVELINPQKGFDKLEGYLDSLENDELTVSYMDKTAKRKAVIKLDNVKLIRLAVKL
jgi:ribosome maturation factor RimP